MTHKAVIRIAQIATPDLYLTDPIKPGRELWHTHASSSHPTRSCSSTTSRPSDRPSGRARRMGRHDRPLGGRPVRTRRGSGLAAWRLPNGTAASMSWIDLSHSQEMPGGWRRYNGGLVTEVSVLTHSFEPVEKLARVVLLKRSTATSPRPRPQPPPCQQTA